MADNANLPYAAGKLLNSIVTIGSSDDSSDSYERTWYWNYNKDDEKDVTSDGAKNGTHWSHCNLEGLGAGDEITVSYKDHTLYEQYRAGTVNHIWLTISAPPFAPAGLIENDSLSQHMAHEYNLQQHSIEDFIERVPLMPHRREQLHSKQDGIVYTASPEVTINNSR